MCLGSLFALIKNLRPVLWQSHVDPSYLNVFPLVSICCQAQYLKTKSNGSMVKKIINNTE